VLQSRPPDHLVDDFSDASRRHIGGAVHNRPNPTMPTKAVTLSVLSSEMGSNVRRRVNENPRPSQRAKWETRRSFSYKLFA
jgi:hypothetical protein